MNSVFHLSRQKNVPIVMLFVVTSVIIGTHFFFSRRSHNLLSSPLRAEESTLDFGQRWAHAPFEWKVTLQNQSVVSLKIEKVETSCNCTSLLEENFDVAPGGTVDLAFRITPQLQHQDTTAARSFLSTITVFVRGHQIPNKFALHGTLQTLATLEPDELFFGRVFQEDCAQASREFVVESYFPLSPVSVVDSGEIPFDVHITAVSPTFDRYRIAVSPMRLSSVGEFDIPLRLNCIPRDHTMPSPPPIHARLTGEIIGDVVSDPPRIDLGVIRDPQNHPLIFRLQSRSKQRFNVSRQFDRPKFLGQPIITESEMLNGVCIQIPLADPDPGSFGGVLVLPVNFHNGKESLVRIPISGFHSREAAAQLSVSSDQLTPK